ncbi:hypothetical protein ACHAXH_006090 [Discostella pseudostelligera]
MTDSKTEFRATIQERLRKDGVLDEITATIRSRILKALLLEKNSILSSALSQHDQHRQSKALLWLLYHFLEQHGYTHTLSVFVAESRLENSIPLSSTDAIKDIGLREIWNEVRKTNHVQTDFISSLQAVVLWVNSLRENHAVSGVQLTETTSTSVQTDEGSILHSCHNVDAQTESNNGSSGENCNEFTVIAIERQCQRRMRQEMNEKLRLSAKKQAIQSTRRLEQKHKDAHQELRHQIEVERSHAKRREIELTKELTQHQKLAHQEREHAEQLIQTMALEMQSQQREIELLNERVKVMQKQRFHEWTDEHDVLHEKTRASLNELHDNKRKLHMQMHAVALQMDEMTSKEMQFAALAQEKSNLLAEIQDLRHRQTAALALQQSSFDRRQSKIQAQLEAVQVKYIAAQGDLDLSRNEVSGLQALLKQSQAAIESVSFRDIGPTSVISPPAIFSRSSMRPSVQLGPRGQSKLGSNLLSAFHPSSTVTCKTGNVSCLREGKYHMPHPSKDVAIASLPVTHLEHAENIQHSNPVKAESTIYRTDSSGKKRNQTVDPPCISSKDPPEEIMPKQNEQSWGHRDDEENDVHGNSIGSLVGNEIVLNISSVTDDLRWHNGNVAKSIPSLVQAALAASPKTMSSSRTEVDAVEEDNADGKDDLNHPALDGICDSIERNEEFETDAKPVCKVAALADEFECLSEPHQNNCDKDALSSQRPSASIADSEPYSEQFNTGNEESNQQLTEGDDEVEAEKHCSPPEPSAFVEAHATATATYSQRSTASIVDSESHFEHLQTWVESINSTAQHHEEAAKLHNSDEVHATATSTANNSQQSTASLANYAQRSTASSVDSDSHSESQCSQTSGEGINSNDQRYEEADRHGNPLGPNQSEYDSDEANVTATATANNPQRSTASLADSEQYSEHFYTFDEGNNHLSAPGNFRGDTAKASSPRSPVSGSSEHYSEEFSVITEIQ